MASQQKIKVLGVGETVSGDRTRGGGKWYRKQLQIWTGEVAGNHTVYAEEDVLNQLVPGDYFIDVKPQAGDRGEIEFRIVDLSPVNAPKEQPKAA